MSEAPNVLIVLSDQHRAMATSLDGNETVHTPTMERLAAEGVHCPHAYANSPICTPSRGTILTGQYPHRHGAVTNDVQMDTNVRTIGDAFADAGYESAWIGKWHLDGVPRDKYTPPGPRRHGFDHWVTYNCHVDFFNGHYYVGEDDEKRRFDAYEPVALTDLALEFLAEQRDNDRPFFLVVSPHPPHAPYEDVPERYKTHYDADAIDVPPNVPEEERSEWAASLADYYAHVTAVDEQLGRLVKWVDDEGERQHTFVCYTSDHGDMFGAHGYWGKSQPYEESVNVPLVCRYPARLPAGDTYSGLVSLVDLAPTLCSLADVEDLPNAQGTDLSEVISAQTDESAPESVFLCYPIPTDNGARQDIPAWRAIRTAQYTYARTMDGEPWLCFDNEADPCQQTNLVDSPDATPLNHRLDAELDRWIQRSGDPAGDAPAYLRATDSVGAWNRRERHMHPDAPALLD